MNMFAAADQALITATNRLWAPFRAVGFRRTRAIVYLGLIEGIVLATYTAILGFQANDLSDKLGAIAWLLTLYLVTYSLHQKVTIDRNRIKLESLITSEELQGTATDFDNGLVNFAKPKIVFRMALVAVAAVLWLGAALIGNVESYFLAGFFTLMAFGNYVECVRDPMRWPPTPE